MKKLEVTDSRVQQAIVLYNSGMAIKPIGKLLKMDGEPIRRILTDLGMLRTRSQAVRIGKGVAKLNEDAFDILTPEALYWIGFLYADGHIEKDRPRITLTLQEKDKSHLEKFNQFMGGRLQIRNVTQKAIKKTPAPGQKNFDGQYYRASFSSQKIHDKLKDLGFTHYKTYSLIPHELLKNSREFWRGVVDGDGWVCYTNQTNRPNYLSMGLSGSEDTLQEFLIYLEKTGFETLASYRKDNRSQVWSINFTSNKAKQILNLLYADSKIYLDRKYEKYINEYPLSIAI